MRWQTTDTPNKDIKVVDEDDNTIMTITAKGRGRHSPAKRMREMTNNVQYNNARMNQQHMHGRKADSVDQSSASAVPMQGTSASSGSGYGGYQTAAPGYQTPGSMNRATPLFVITEEHEREPSIKSDAEQEDKAERYGREAREGKDASPSGRKGYAGKVLYQPMWPSKPSATEIQMAGQNMPQVKGHGSEVRGSRSKGEGQFANGALLASGIPVVERQKSIVQEEAIQEASRKMPPGLMNKSLIPVGGGNIKERFKQLQSYQGGPGGSQQKPTYVVVIKRKQSQNAEKKVSIVNEPEQIADDELKRPGLDRKDSQESKAKGDDDFNLEYNPSITLPGPGLLQRLQNFSMALHMLNKGKRTPQKEVAVRRVTNDMLDAMGTIAAENTGRSVAMVTNVS